MTKRLLTLLLVAASTLIFSGCSPLTPRIDAAHNYRDPVNDLLDDVVCSIYESDSETTKCKKLFEVKVDGNKFQPSGYRARLLRGHVIAAGLTRLAAARIGPGTDSKTEAYRAIQSLLKAEKDLIAARKQLDQTRYLQPYYYVQRVDAQIALITLADAATLPSRRQTRDLILGDPATLLAHGPEILKNAIKDIAYINAYSHALVGQLEQNAHQDSTTLETAWEVYNPEILENCKTLKKLAGDLIEKSPICEKDIQE